MLSTQSQRLKMDAPSIFRLHIIIDGTTNAILGYSYSDTFTEVISETKSADTIENGENTITVNIPNFHPELLEKYYFGLRLTNTADNILDSGRYVVGYTYIESGKDTKYLARFISEEPKQEYLPEGLYYTFKTVDGVECIYLTAMDGYYIHEKQAVKFDEGIDADKLEINPDTDYWRCK